AEWLMVHRIIDTLHLGFPTIERRTANGKPQEMHAPAFFGCISSNEFLTCPLRPRRRTTPEPSCEVAAEAKDVPSGGAQGAAGDRSAPTRAAKAAGVAYPKLLCGCSSLYSFRHASILLRASHKF